MQKQLEERFLKGKPILRGVKKPDVWCAAGCSRVTPCLSSSVGLSCRHLLYVVWMSGGSVCSSVYTGLEGLRLFLWIFLSWLNPHKCSSQSKLEMFTPWRNYLHYT